jgi:chromate transport protein ChrA
MEFCSGTLALVISLAGSWVYIRSILQGKTKPHLYTHLAWGIITAIAFFAQVSDNAGPGAWAIGVTAAACLAQAALALKYGEKDITRNDHISLCISLLAIVSWAVTKNPLLAVILACVVDLVAYYPTFRKSWLKPWEENLTAYNIANVKLALSLTALTNVTWVTALYPAVGLAANLAFVAACLLRRRSLGIIAA